MGWQFTVTIPSWTQTVLQHQEIVVFYRVEVRVQSAEEAGLARMRSVLRRFSHFMKFYDKLKEELGAKILAGKEAPSKRSFFNVNKRPDLIEQRRRDLEQWLWRLVSDPLIARSKVLNKFLELGVAARLVEQSLQARFSSSQTETAEEASIAGVAETATEWSGDGSQSGWDANSVNTDQLSETRTVSTARSRGVSLNCSVKEQPMLEQQAMRMRLGLHIEQRTNVKKQVFILKQRLETASQDLLEAVGRLRLEQEKNEHSTQRVAELEARLAAESSVREAELDNLLQLEKNKNSTLIKQLEAQSSQNDLLREQLGELGLHGGEPTDLPQVDKACAPSAETSQLLEEVDNIKEALKIATDQLALLQTQKSALEEKYRTDLKVLAKEVKTLRRQLATTNGTVTGHNT